MSNTISGLTSVSVGLGPVPVLQPVGPGPLVPGHGDRGLAHPVAALEALCPLAAVEPAPAGLHAQTMALAVLPVTLEGAPARKG